MARAGDARLASAQQPADRMRRIFVPFAGLVLAPPLCRALRLVSEREKVVATHLVIVLYQDKRGKH